MDEERGSLDSVEIRDRDRVSMEKKECTQGRALFLFGDILCRREEEGTVEGSIGTSLGTTKD